MDWNTFITVISVIAAICGVVYGAINYSRNKKKDNAEDGKESGVILTELGYIKSGVDDLKRKQDKQDEQMLNLLRQLTAVEESSKQAHKRLDALEARFNAST